MLYDAGGVLFAVPIPSEAAADGTRIEAAIQQALQEADEQAVVSDDAFTPTLRETWGCGASVDGTNVHTSSVDRIPASAHPDCLLLPRSH